MLFKAFFQFLRMSVPIKNNLKDVPEASFIKASLKIIIKKISTVHLVLMVLLKKRI